MDFKTQTNINGTEQSENIIYKLIDTESSECLHLTCPNCSGTGKDSIGRICIHMLSCPCHRCTPRY